MHTGESLVGLFEQLLRSKPLPLNGWDFVRVHCTQVVCMTRAGMTPKLIPNREAEAGEKRWTMRFDSYDTHPKRNRDAIRFGIIVLLHDHFGISLRDIPSAALAELESRLEELMLGDGAYVPFAEQCSASSSLALARVLPTTVVAIRPARTENASERSFQRGRFTTAELHCIFSTEVSNKVLRYGQ